jgi:hypothetical protein
MRECQLLRDVLGRIFQAWTTAGARFNIFIDTSLILVNVRVCYSEFSVFGFQFSVNGGKRSQTGDGTGPVHLLYPLAQRDPPTPTGHFRTFSNTVRNPASKPVQVGLGWD